MIVLFAGYPSNPMNGDVEVIKIEYWSDIVFNDGKPNMESRIFTITAKDEIHEFKEQFGIVWNVWWPMNSWEGVPRWMIIIEYKDGRVKKLYVDLDEFDNAINPKHKSLISYLMKNYS